MNISRSNVAAVGKYMSFSLAFALATTAMIGFDGPRPESDRASIEQTLKTRIERMPDGFRDIVVTSFNDKAGKAAHLVFDARLKTESGMVPYTGEADCTAKNCSLVTMALK